MALVFTPEEEAFRAEVRSFFQNEYPKEFRDKVAAGEEFTREEEIASHKVYAKAGYVAPKWPVQFGGKDWSPIQHYIWSDEMIENHGGPWLGQNVGMIGPAICEFATPDQLERFLGPTYNGDIYWAQGFSEPNAGSDLASLQTRAVRDGDHYVVNGQKMWQTGGHKSNWIFTLVRTNPDAPKKQMGISFLLIDMNTPGVEVRKIRLMDGGWEVNEVFFDNVIVPVENCLGAENDGWTVAKFVLGNERGGMSNAKGLWREFEGAKRAAAQVDLGTGTLLEDPIFRARLAELETSITAYEQTGLRVGGTSKNGKPNPASSILKLRMTELIQAVNLLVVDVAGKNARAFDRVDGLTGVEKWQSKSIHTYLNTRKVTIFGGSSEVQRGIIASAILGA